MIEELEQRIAEQDRMIQYLSEHNEKLVTNKDKIYGLIRAYDRGETTATMLVSYLRVYVR